MKVIDNIWVPNSSTMSKVVLVKQCERHSNNRIVTTCTCGSKVGQDMLTSTVDRNRLYAKKIRPLEGNLPPRGYFDGAKLSSMTQHNVRQSHVPLHIVRDRTNATNQSSPRLHIVRQIISHVIPPHSHSCYRRGDRLAPSPRLSMGPLRTRSIHPSRVKEFPSKERSLLASHKYINEEPTKKFRNLGDNDIGRVGCHSLLEHKHM